MSDNYTPNISHPASQAAGFGGGPTVAGDGATNRNTFNVCSGNAAIISVLGHNSGPDQWIQVLDGGAGNGDAPVLPAIWVPADQNFAIDYGKGRSMPSGITVSNSSTQLTLTAGAADCTFEVTYYGGTE